MTLAVHICSAQWAVNIPVICSSPQSQVSTWLRGPQTLKWEVGAHGDRVRLLPLHPNMDAPASTFGCALVALDVGAHATPSHLTWSVVACLKPPTPTPWLSQTRLLSVGWVCWSVIGWVLNIIPQALMLNITRQSCKTSAVGQMLLCKDSQTCITRPPSPPVDSLAFWMLCCQSWRLLHFFFSQSVMEKKGNSKEPGKLLLGFYYWNINKSVHLQICASTFV